MLRIESLSKAQCLAPLGCHPSRNTVRPALRSRDAPEPFTAKAEPPHSWRPTHPHAADTILPVDTALNHTLERSNVLEVALFAYLSDAGHDGSLRSRVTTTLCGIAFEHANSLRSLITSGNHTSAVALLRPQFEAVTRAVWLHYAATDTAVAKLVAPLTPETEKSAGDSPSMKEMLDAIERKAHPSASQMLARFKEQSWKAMNSFVHGGTHPVNRFGEGYPPPLLVQVLQNSNGLSTMAAMVLALLSGDANIVRRVSQCQPEFEDCLPPFVAPQNTTDPATH